MSPHEWYDIWAPDSARWSPWVKPVLFAHFGESQANEPGLQEMDVAWAPRAGDNAAIIADLPGAGAVACGLALAQRGFRPVPLYNTHPHPNAAVEVDQIVTAMRSVSLQLRAIILPSDAPPAFLLDANRLKIGTRLTSGVFDNRWMVFPQDFPSASFLQSSGIRTAIFVQIEAGQPRDDLRHVLRRWQEAGISIASKRTNSGSAPAESIEVTRPSGFRSLIRRWAAAWDLRRNSAGGFGSLIPEPRSSGGFA